MSFIDYYVTDCVVGNQTVYRQAQALSVYPLLSNKIGWHRNIYMKYVTYR